VFAMHDVRYDRGLDADVFSVANLDRG